MKENKRKDKQKKDYYFSVMLSQVFTVGAVLLAFFVLKGGETGREISDSYKRLLKEDFLTYSVSSAVSQFKDYLSSDKVFAVFGTAVEGVEVTTAPTTEAVPTTVETTVKKEPEEPSAQVFATADVSQIAFEQKKEKVKPQSMTLENKEPIDRKMVFPVQEGRYTSFFGERTDPISEGSDYHNGVDIGADEGDEIFAVYDGTVTLTGEDDRSGKYIFLSHDDSTVTFYCHCSEILLEQGDKVSRGEVIALVGSTGYSTGPHLHFELRIDGESTDPLPLLENAD